MTDPKDTPKDRVRARLFPTAKEDRSEPPPGYWVRPPENYGSDWTWGILVDGGGPWCDFCESREEALRLCWAHHDVVLASAGVERLQERLQERLKERAQQCLDLSDEVAKVREERDYYKKLSEGAIQGQSDLGKWAEDLARIVYGVTGDMRLTPTSFLDVTAKVRELKAKADGSPALRVPDGERLTEAERACLAEAEAWNEWGKRKLGLGCGGQDGASMRRDLNARFTQAALRVGGGRGFIDGVRAAESKLRELAQRCNTDRLSYEAHGFKATAELAMTRETTLACAAGELQEMAEDAERRCAADAEMAEDPSPLGGGERLVRAATEVRRLDAAIRHAADVHYDADARVKRGTLSGRRHAEICAALDALGAALESAPPGEPGDDAEPMPKALCPACQRGDAVERITCERCDACWEVVDENPFPAEDDGRFQSSCAVCDADTEHVHVMRCLSCGRHRYPWGGAPEEHSLRGTQAPTEGPPEGARVHDLKVWPDYYRFLVTGEKTFELRKDDRGYRAGDWLRLREWSRRDGYTGREMTREVTYLTCGAWLAPDHVCMALGREAVLARKGASDA